MTATTRTTRTRTTTETLTTTATGTTTRTRTTTTTRTTTRTRKAPAAASEPEVPPSPPSAPAQEAGHPAEAAPVPPVPTAPRSPRADKDPAPSEKTEVFEGVRIRVGSVHPRGGYVHWRSRRQVLAEGLDIGIPPEVIHHPDLMTDGHKPSATAYKRAEKLIAQVKQAKARGEDPAPLWKRWLPAKGKRAR